MTTCGCMFFDDYFNPKYLIFCTLLLFLHRFSTKTIQQYVKSWNIGLMMNHTFLLGKEIKRERIEIIIIAIYQNSKHNENFFQGIEKKAKVILSCFKYSVLSFLSFHFCSISFTITIYLYTHARARNKWLVNKMKKKIIWFQQSNMQTFYNKHKQIEHLQKYKKWISL